MLEHEQHHRQCFCTNFLYEGIPSVRAETIYFLFNANTLGRFEFLKVNICPLFLHI